MTYSREDSEAALFKHYWKWHGEQSQPGTPGKHRRLRERGEGAKWSQIRDAVLSDQLEPDPSEQENRGLTVAAAAGLFNVGPGALKDLLWDDHVRRQLLGLAPKPFAWKDVAQTLGLTVDECKAAKKNPALIPDYPLSTSHLSASWKHRVKKGNNTLSNPKSTPEQRQAVEKQQALFKAAREALLASGVLQDAATGLKSKASPRVLIDWADIHPDLKAWRNARPDKARIGGSLEEVTKYVQVTAEGRLVTYKRLPKEGGVPELVTFSSGIQEGRRLLLKAGLIELNKRGGFLKLERQEATFAEAFAMQWAKPEQRSALVIVYTEALNHWSDVLGELAESASQSATIAGENSKDERLTVRQRAAWEKRQVLALQEEKQAIEWSRRARQAAMAALLPPAVPGPPKPRPRF